MSLTRAFWVVFAAMVLVYCAMVLWSLPIIMSDANGLMPFDLRPSGYTTEEARAFLSALSESGRAHYLGVQHKLDTLYPGLMALSLILAYLLLFPTKWAAGFSVLAGLAAVFDWSENSAVADLLRLGAEGIDEEVVSAAAQFTMLKSGFVAVALTILLVGVAGMMWRRWKGQAV
ncbi:hypothetical protein MWU53_14725 [Aliiroseovarius sp. S1123]|jgi:hypothetical protein|uniref:hypothetical protein n=1 Tax=unclassified Aliiroseovarius TaxID=2623558 RepID=UPI001FF66AF1|nr:hypothetical protein [Aliiroseovarius sp. S1123]MCK0172315.1 hypothetical protein [Aliiroseovarius sp. S1123]